MIIFKIRDFMSSIIPLLYISKLLGLAPLFLHKNANENSPWKYKAKIIINTTYTFTASSLIIWFFADQISYYWNEVYPLALLNFTISDIYSKILLYSTPFVSIISSLTQSSKLSKILQEIRRVDEKLVTKTNVYIIIFFVLLIEIILALSCIIGLFVLIFVTWGMENLVFSFYECLMHIIALFVDLQFINILFYVRYLYKQLNNELHSFVGCHGDAEINKIVFFKKLTVDKVCELQNIHKDLQEVAETMCNYLSQQLALEVNSLFFQLVSTSYNWVQAIKLYVTYGKQDYIMRIFSISCWVVFYLANLFFLCVSGQLCRNEAYKTFTLVHKLMLNEILSPQVLNTLNKFVFYASAMKLRVTNGLFDIDMTLFLKTFGAAFVYVTFLLQMQY